MFLPIVLATVCLASSLVLAANDKPYYEVEDAENLFQEFLKQHNKVYNQREYLERLDIFKENLRDINKRNAMFPDTVFAVNHFADLKPHELEPYFGFKLSNEVLTQETVIGPAPDSFDWREHNVVTHVKNQGQCGSCYIFSAVGNIEGQYALAHKQCLAFSEQQWLDCLDMGFCGIHDMNSLMQEIINKKYKLGKEEDYPPYAAEKKKCRADPKEGIVLVLNATVTKMDEEALKNKLASYGPLSIAVDDSEIGYYSEGILEPQKPFEKFNHNVLLVGYGEEGGKKFWIIKNSWGEGWGEQGYVRVVRGVGACGIGKYVSYSTVA